MANTWQTIRVFISSTFRDMHSERDWLVKRVFPALRERLEKYRIRLIDVDLRWGVTEQQAESGGALDVCLEQIDECRPFFLGILGERYGFMSPELLMRINANPKFHDLQPADGRSITELEILYGVLKKLRMHDHAFFCFRDPAFIQDVPAEKQSDIRAEDDVSAVKIKELKDTIRKANLPKKPLENYACRYAGLRINWRLAKLELQGQETDLGVLEEVAKDGLVDPDEYARLTEPQRKLLHRFSTVQLTGLEEFGTRVGDWLWEVIRKRLDLPDHSAPVPLPDIDPLSDENDAHARFIESRLQVYVGQERLQKDLNRYAMGNDGVPCMVTGPSGSGKSAALAKFATNFPCEHPEVFVIPHFIGAYPASTNLHRMLERFCLMLKNRFDFPDEIPVEIVGLISLLGEFLRRTPAEQRVVLVIDALNQLDESDRARDLHWFPWSFPENVKVVVSCLDDRAESQRVIQAFDQHLHLPIAVRPLDRSEQLELSRRVPSLSAKTLDDRQLNLLLANPATRNPLYLRVALEELRGFGSYEQLNRRIEMFPRGPNSLVGIFRQVIERLEQDFDSSIVASVLSLLASARRGLSEREFVDMIEGPHVELSDCASDLFPVLRQLRAYLQPRGQLLDFFHRDLFRAVLSCYLDGGDKRRVSWDRLAEYFQTQPFYLESTESQIDRQRHSPLSVRPCHHRKLDELPYLLLAIAKNTDPSGDSPDAPEWDRIVDLLLDWTFLEAKVESGMIVELSQDIAAVREAIPVEHPRGPMLETVEELLHRHVAFLRPFPTLLLQTMWNEASAGLGGTGELSEWLGKWRRSTQGRSLFIQIGTGESHSPLRRQIRTPHSSITAMVVYADDTLIATSGNEGAICVWERHTQSLRERLAVHSAEVKSLAVRHQSGQVLSGSTDGEVRLSCPQSKSSVVLAAHTAPCYSVATSPDGSWLAAGWYDGLVQVWNTGNLEESRPFPGPEFCVRSLVFSSDSRHLAAGSDDLKVFVWDVAKGRLTDSFPAHTLEINKLIFSDTDQLIVTGSSDRTACIWNWRNHRRECTLSGHDTGVFAIACHLDNEIATGGSDQTIRVWRAPFGDAYSSWVGHDRKVTELQYLTDGTLVSASLDGTLREWRVVPLDRKSPEPAPVPSCLAVFRDGRHVIVGSQDGVIMIWDTSSGKRVKQSRLTTVPITVVEISEDSTRILAGSAEGEAWILTPDLSQTAHRPQMTDAGGVVSAAISRDGGRVVIAQSRDRDSFATATIWDPNSGSALGTVRQVKNGHNAVVGITADGTRFAVATYGHVALYQASNQRRLAEFRDFSGDVIDLAFAPSGDALVICTKYATRVGTLSDTPTFALWPAGGRARALADPVSYAYWLSGQDNHHLCRSTTSREARGALPMNSIPFDVSCGNSPRVVAIHENHLVIYQLVHE